MPALSELEQRIAQLVQQAIAIRQEEAAILSTVRQLGSQVAERSQQLSLMQSELAQIRQGMDNITPE